MRKSLFSLLLVVFIDAAGIGILFPILNSIIMNPNQNFLPYSTTISVRHFYYSLVVATFFIAWFFGATFISKTSDSIGRKKSLIICLLGVFLGYTFTVIAMYIGSISLLIIGRILAGLTAGSQPVAQAAIIDVSTPENKAKNLGFIMTAFAIGMVLGPIIGGILSDHQLIHYFNNELPFYVILAITLINIYMVLAFYNDVERVREKFKFSILDLITQFNLMIKDKKLMKLSLIFFIMQMAFNTVYVFIAVFLYQKFQFSTLQNSIVMLIFGVSNAISCSLLVHPISRVFKHAKIVSVSLIVMALAIFLLTIVKASFLVYILAIPFMGAFGLAYTSMLTLFSNSVTEEKQGWVMGLTVSLFTLGAAITALFGGWLIDISISLPFMLATIAFVLSGFLFLIFRKDLMNLN